MDKSLVLIFFRYVEDIKSFLTYQESLKSRFSTINYGMSKFSFISIVSSKYHLEEWLATNHIFAHWIQSSIDVWLIQKWSMEHLNLRTVFIRMFGRLIMNTWQFKCLVGCSIGRLAIDHGKLGFPRVRSVIKWELEIGYGCGQFHSRTWAESSKDRSVIGFGTLLIDW